jgi:dihydropteroate synthase
MMASFGSVESQAPPHFKGQDNVRHLLNAARSLRLAGGRRLDLSRPRVMAILNATPDSFSDGGRLAQDLDRRIRAAVDAGADVLDVGGESTRPGHTPVAADEELRRVIPVVEACRRLAPDVPISIDTRKAAVAKAALAAGAALVNDVAGLDDLAMADVVRDAGAGVVLMRHRDLTGREIRGSDRFADSPDSVARLVAACRDELAALVAKAQAEGIPDDAIALDPGLGFGDPPGGDPAANWALLRGVADYAQGFPVLIGASRKRFVAEGEAVPERRVAGSVRAAVEAVQAGASIVRVHDVRETVEALRRLPLRPASGSR